MIAEVLHELCIVLHGGSGLALPLQIRKQISDIVPAIEKARLYRGRGGELMRGATTRLIEVCALLRMPAGPRAALKMLASIDDSLKHPIECISTAAVAALHALSRASFIPPAAGKDERLVERYAKPLATDPNAALRRGYALALGALPAHQLRADLEGATRVLLVTLRIEDSAEMRDPEARRNAVRALVQLTKSVGLAAFPPPPTALATGTITVGGDTPALMLAPAARDGTGSQLMSTELYVDIVEALMVALGDYQTDNRGDVGSWVREAAMCGILELLVLGCAGSHGSELGTEVNAGMIYESTASHVNEHNPPNTPNGTAVVSGTAAERAAMSVTLPRLCECFVAGLVQQQLEKIDRMREAAGKTMRALLQHPLLPRPPHYMQLLRLFIDETEKQQVAGVSNDATIAGAVDRAIDPSTVVPLSVFTSTRLCYPLFVRLLWLPAYRKDALRGLCVSVGGVTESTMRASSEALLKHVRALEEPELVAFAGDLSALLQEHIGHPRLAHPLMRTLQALLEARLFDRLLDLSNGSMPSLIANLCEAFRPVLRSSKDMRAIMTALSLQVLLLPYTEGSLLSESLRLVLLLLGHRYPKVRKSAADLIYVHFVTFGDPGPLSTLPDLAEPHSLMALNGGGISAAAGESLPVAPGRLDELIAVLLETPWLESLDNSARPARAKVLKCLGLPAPRACTVAPKTTFVEDVSYKELVGEVGY